MSIGGAAVPADLVMNYHMSDIAQYQWAPGRLETVDLETDGHFDGYIPGNVAVLTQPNGSGYFYQVSYPTVPPNAMPIKITMTTELDDNGTSRTFIQDMNSADSCWMRYTPLISGTTPNPNEIVGETTQTYDLDSRRLTVTLSWGFRWVDSPMTKLAALLDEMAPHYHIDRPEDVGRLGRDIITGYFVGRGLGYLLKNVPAALNALFGPAARATIGDIPEAGITGLQPPVVSPSTWYNPPPGATMPIEMSGRWMPLYPQEMEASCGPACARAITATVRGVDVGESPFREPAVWSAEGGSWPQQLKTMLDAAGIRNSGFMTGQTLDQLAQGTRNGPVVIGTGQVQDGSLVSGIGHAKILDGVSGIAPNRFFWLRDPMNLDLEPPLIRDFIKAAGFEGHEVVPEISFSNSFWGEAIYTKMP